MRLLNGASRARSLFFGVVSAASHVKVELRLPHVFLKQGTPADVLYKGTITRLITEDSASRAERERDEALSKGHVVYEGIGAHILTYDRKYFQLCQRSLSFLS